MKYGLSVAEAAKELGVSVRRVRQLISADDLPADRVGRSWVVPREAVERLARRHRRHGRRLSADNSWALLALLAGAEPDLAKPSTRSRLHRYAHDPDWLLDLFRNAEPRAKVLPLWVPAEDLKELAEYSLVRSGLSAREAVSQLDVVPRDDEPLDAYADARTAVDVLRRFTPEEDAPDPNVILRIPKSLRVLGTREEAPLPIVAADLLDHDDARVRRAAEVALRQLAIAG